MLKILLVVAEGGCPAGVVDVFGREKSGLLGAGVVAVVPGVLPNKLGTGSAAGVVGTF